MTSIQLFIAVGVPVMAIVLGVAVNLLSNNRIQDRLDRLDETVRKGFERLDDRVDRLSERAQATELSLSNLRAELFEKFQPRSA